MSWHPENLKRGKLYEFWVDDIEGMATECGYFRKIEFHEGVLCIRFESKKPAKPYLLPVKSILAVHAVKKGSK